MIIKRNKKTGRSLTLNLILLFSITMFVTITFSMLIIGFGLLVLLRIQLFVVPEPLLLFFNISFLSIIISTIIARIIAAKVFAPIQELNRATRQIADGNFHVSLEEKGNVDEILEMAHNFNRMAEELRRTEIVHNDFMRNVSHEIKTPLSSIEGYATLLQTPGLPEEKRQDYAARIISSTKRLTTMTGNILMLSRLENRQTGIRQAPFSLDEQLRQIVLLYECQWLEKELNLNLELPSITYFGCEELLFQVWQNLFGNAVKFCNIKGFICITMENHKKEVIISVHNTGLGIAQQDLNRIFEKFYQGEKSHSTPGNGLGLAIVRQIVDIHGGTVHASSSPEDGTVFVVKLPIHECDTRRNRNHDSET